VDDRSFRGQEIRQIKVQILKHAMPAWTARIEGEGRFCPTALKVSRKPLIPFP
jgi:hypothetical protein